MDRWWEWGPHVFLSYHISNAWIKFDNPDAIPQQVDLFIGSPVLTTGEFGTEELPTILELA